MKPVRECILNMVLFNWLTGPILVKEMRVTSRRRRGYVLRAAFILLLTLVLALLWLNSMDAGSSALYHATYMAEVGRMITGTVVWFEFLVFQLIAGIALSTAISDELTHQTLGVLMTTPVTSLQIVFGKLSSRLLQLGLLMGLTLPLLAVVRVFGGVPWTYIGSSMAIIFSSSLLAGALSLFYSVYTRRAYLVIIATILTLGILYGVVPLLGALFLHDVLSDRTLMMGFGFVNPFIQMGWITERLLSARAGFRGQTWWVHVLMMVSMAGGILLLATWRVRAVAMAQIAGGGRRSQRARKKKTGYLPRLRAVRGNPILWKEKRRPLLGSHRWRNLCLLLGAMLLMGLIYLGIWREGGLDDRDVHMTFGLFLTALGLLYAVVIPATCITTEKESRAWPLLLGTSLSTRQMLVGKFLGSLRRCLPAWWLLALHLILFTVGMIIHPLGVPLLVLALIGPMALLLCSGLFFSMWFQRTTVAVIANVTLALSLWALIPLIMALFTGITNTGESLLELYICGNPLVSVGCILERCARGWGVLGRFEWPAGRLTVGELVGALVLINTIYLIAGAMFIFFTVRCLRRRIF